MVTSLRSLHVAGHGTARGDGNQREKSIRSRGITRELACTFIVHTRRPNNIHAFKAPVEKRWSMTRYAVLCARVQTAADMPSQETVILYSRMKNSSGSPINPWRSTVSNYPSFPSSSGAMACRRLELTSNEKQETRKIVLRERKKHRLRVLVRISKSFSVSIPRNGQLVCNGFSARKSKTLCPYVNSRLKADDNFENAI